MKKSILVMITILMVMVFTGSAYATGKAAGTPLKKPANPVTVNSCFEGCHGTVEMLYTRGVHKNVNCGMCHEVPASHILEPAAENRPTVRTDHRSCAACHDKELASMLDTQYHMSWAAKNEIPTYAAIRNSEAGLMDQVQSRFPRYHIGMIADLAVNRTAGRFKYKNMYDVGKPVENLWDAVYDAHPEDGDAFKIYERTHPWRPQKSVGVVTAAMCLKCKTTDNMLEYAYMGEPAEGTAMQRDSMSMPAFKNINNSANCNFCHDPHSAEPRIVNDMLIESMINPAYKDNAFQSEAYMPGLEVLEMGERGYTRKIVILDRYDSNFMCGQCHTSPNASAGLRDRDTGQSFPGGVYGNPYSVPFQKGPLETYEYYLKNNWYNAIHSVTGTMWTNPPGHPHVEIVSQSVHGKAGIGCTDCHYAQEGKGKNTYRSHQVSLPKEKTGKTCLRSDCHGAGTDANWTTEAEALYAIEAIQQKSRVRIAEMNHTINQAVAFIKEINQGIYTIETAALNDLHTALARALTVDSYWFGEYSMGFHNPQLFEDSTTTVIREMNSALAEAKSKARLRN